VTTTSKKPRLKLYWCTTEDHDEDWFIIARSMRSARRDHELSEGYDDGDATAKLVAAVPDSLQETAKEGWPEDDEIEACGGVFVRNPDEDGLTAGQARMGSGGRIVRFGKDFYVEGDISANVAARHKTAGEKE
jgi:hypothetical protein